MRNSSCDRSRNAGGTGGLFIVVDGADGTGKTTVMDLLCARLPRVCRTAEPSRSSYGQQARDVLRGGGDAQALCDLFVRDRAAHLAAEILPALDAGQTVLCDRYKYANIVYQQLQGIAAAELIAQNAAFRVPDAVFILDPPDVDVLLGRIAARGGDAEIFERRDTLERVASLYRALPALLPHEPIRLVSCAGNPKEIAETILHEIGV